MAGEVDTIANVYMGDRFMAILDEGKPLSLVGEIDECMRQDLAGDTAEWLESVATQYLLREAFVVQKAEVARLSSMADQPLKEKVAAFIQSFAYNLALRNLDKTEPEAVRLDARRSRIENLCARNPDTLLGRFVSIRDLPAGSVIEAQELIGITWNNVESFSEQLTNMVQVYAAEGYSPENTSRVMFEEVNAALDRLIRGVMATHED